MEQNSAIKQCNIIQFSQFLNNSAEKVLQMVENIYLERKFI